MLTQEQNENLTRVGPGTPMGELMRRYWHPVAASVELKERPVKEIRILGEDLVLFKDRSGRDVLSEGWGAGYAHLEAFHAAHGHMRVPQSFKGPDGYRLGLWVSRQRQLAHRLGPERRKQLDALGFVWNGFNEAREAGYAHLEAFHAEHGHTRVPQNFKSSDGYRLGSWVSHQRRRADLLNPELRARLDALGFVWKVRS